MENKITPQAENRLQTHVGTADIGIVACINWDIIWYDRQHTVQLYIPLMTDPLIYFSINSDSCYQETPSVDYEEDRYTSTSALR